MAIHKYGQQDARLKPIAEWLADICVQEADTKKKGWNFETWKGSGWAKTVLAVHGEEELKWSYLNECHDVLDHAQWHLRVFKPDTQYLIREVYELFIGQECFLRDLKKHF